MSVVNVEEYETKLPGKDELPERTWLCQDCHTELATTMNIGYGRKGVCQRCGATKHTVYMIDKGNIL